MRAILSTLTYDVLGTVELALLATTRWGRSERRVNRVRTLDGGYALNDGGHADCDRDIQLRWRPDADLDTRVDYLMRYYGELYLSSPYGFWRVAPRHLEIDRAEARMDLYVLERIAA
jgi:hypothetical protein